MVAEVLPNSENNRRWDEEVKLNFYSIWGVQEYWIVDWHQKSIQVYRREGAQLQLFATLMLGDRLPSSLLPEFDCAVSKIFRS